MGAFSDLIGSFAPLPETRLPPEDKPAPDLAPPLAQKSLRETLSASIKTTSADPDSRVAAVTQRALREAKHHSGSMMFFPRDLAELDQVHSRIFFSTMFLGDKSPITADTLRSEETATLKRLVISLMEEELSGKVSRARREGNPNQFHILDLPHMDITEEDRENRSALFKFLGGFTLRRNEKDEVEARDFYKFGPYLSERSLGFTRRFGQSVIPAGRGREVRINLGPAKDFPGGGKNIPLESETPVPVPKFDDSDFANENRETPLEVIFRTLTGK